MTQKQTNSISMVDVNGRYLLYNGYWNLEQQTLLRYVSGYFVCSAMQAQKRRCALGVDGYPAGPIDSEHLKEIIMQLL